MVFFTDLDGTLLGHDDYDWRPAARALEMLRRRRIPLVLVTSKTRAEVRPLLTKLRRREPFVTENGGAVYFPDGYFPFRIRNERPAGAGWRCVAFGVPRRLLLAALRRAARQAGAKVRPFAEMEAREVAGLTGLSLREARLAMQREFDEPFVLREEARAAWPRLRRAIRDQGLRATRGGRFFHILGRNDKGAAVRKLKTWFRRLGRGPIRAVGLGDSPNDVALLRAVDVPILVARPGGRYDRETLAAVPRARRAGGVGPAGWNRAVLKLLGRRPCAVRV
jgi:mannosyl-3-phosphoglycerate phosphatase